MLTVWLSKASEHRKNTVSHETRAATTLLCTRNPNSRPGKMALGSSSCQLYPPHFGAQRPSNGARLVQRREQKVEQRGTGGCSRMNREASESVYGHSRCLEHAHLINTGRYDHCFTCKNTKGLKCDTFVKVMLLLS